MEALVRLLVHQYVLDRGGTQPVTPELVGAVGGVGPRIEDGGVVVGPGHAVGRPFDLTGHVPTGLEVAHPEGEALVSGRVHGVGEPGVSGTDRQIGDIEVGAVTGEFVLVEENLLVGPGPEFGSGVVRLRPGRDGRVASLPVDREPAVDGVVAALDGAGVVPPPVLANGYGQVRLDDPRPDLAEEPLAEVGQVSGGGRRVRVLGLQELEDGRVVPVAQPQPVVHPAVAVDLEDGGPPGGRGRSADRRCPDLRAPPRRFPRGPPEGSRPRVDHSGADQNGGRESGTNRSRRRRGAKGPWREGSHSAAVVWALPPGPAVVTI